MNDTTNPKDANGRAKIPLHLWPTTATAYGAMGMHEGELKYGRNNFRGAPVAASVYIAAAKRHLDAWMEGEDVSDMHVPHLGNALACIAIIIDAHVNGTLVDDRNYTPNPGAYGKMIAELTEHAVALRALLKDKDPHHWTALDSKSKPMPDSWAEWSKNVEYKTGAVVAITADEKKLLDFGCSAQAILNRRYPLPFSLDMTSEEHQAYWNGKRLNDIWRERKVLSQVEREVYDKQS